MTLFLSPIVEGKTEDTCLETLIHRVWNEILPSQCRLQVLEAIVAKRDQLLSTKHPHLSDSVDRAVIMLKHKLRGESGSLGAVLLLLDAEKDCPRELAQELLSRAKRDDSRISCVIANRMFENWIVAGSSTLVGVCGLPDSFTVPTDCEAIDGAKWLKIEMKRKKPSRTYRKTVDALEFVRRIKLADCHEKSRSFRKLCKDLQALILPTAASESASTSGAESQARTP